MAVEELVFPRLYILTGSTVDMTDEVEYVVEMSELVIGPGGQMLSHRLMWMVSGLVNVVLESDTLDLDFQGYYADGPGVYLLALCNQLSVSNFFNVVHMDKKTRWILKLQITISPAVHLLTVVTDTIC